ncbi:hypothetical protein KEM54_005503, partial [Ascosphaera aggregata]
MTTPTSSKPPTSGPGALRPLEADASSRMSSLRDGHTRTTSQLSAQSNTLRDGFDRVTEMRSSPVASKPAHNRRRLKSQYPRDSQSLHVEYVLVAHFHYGIGSRVQHQFPSAITGNQNRLGELMIPEGMHSRDEDWTIFFLHKDVEPEGEDDYFKRNTVPYDDDTEEKSDEEGGYSAGPPLMYVLSLVNVKRDPNKYFEHPTIGTIDEVYRALNSMDLSLMPRLSLLETQILQICDVKDMFIEKFKQMVWQKVEDDKAAIIRDGGDPEVLNTLDYTIPRDTHDFPSAIKYNDIAIPVKIPTAVVPETVGDFSIIKLIQTFSLPHAKLPQPFPHHPHLTSNGPYTHPMIVLVNAILTQKRVLFLGHEKYARDVAEAVLAACALASGGILRGFTRYAFPYTDLTKVDDLAEVPGYVAGVTNQIYAHKPMWWDLLCDLSTGRMVISQLIEPAPASEGTTYFHQPDTPTSTGLHGTPHSDPTGDKAFMDSVLRSIASRHGESVVRAKWRAYINKFTRIAAAFEEVVYGATALYIMNPVEEAFCNNRSGNGPTDSSNPAVLYGHGYVWPDEATKHRELSAWAWRIEGWRKTRSYYQFTQNAAATFHAVRPVQTMDINHHHDRLRVLKLGHVSSAAIYTALYHSINDYRSICQLLAVALESGSGLLYIAMGLLHPDKPVREMTSELLDRIASHEAGRHLWAKLDKFLRVAHERVTKERDNAGEKPRIGFIAPDQMAHLSLSHMIFYYKSLIIPRVDAQFIVLFCLDHISNLSTFASNPYLAMKLRPLGLCRPFSLASATVDASNRSRSISLSPLSSSSSSSSPLSSRHNLLRYVIRTVPQSRSIAGSRRLNARECDNLECGNLRSSRSSEKSSRFTGSAASARLHQLSTVQWSMRHLGPGNGAVTKGALQSRSLFSKSVRNQQSAVISAKELSRGARQGSEFSQVKRNASKVPARDPNTELRPDASSRLSTMSTRLPKDSLKRKLAAYLALTKPHLSFLVVLTATTAYGLYPTPTVLELDSSLTQLPTLSTSTLTFFYLGVGTFLTSASAATLN